MYLSAWQKDGLIVLWCFSSDIVLIFLVSIVSASVTNCSDVLKGFLFFGYSANKL